MSNFFDEMAKVKIIDNHEKLIEITNKEIIYKHSYKNNGFSGALDKVYARESVVQKLDNISKLLKEDGLTLGIFDAYRPLVLQKFLGEQFSDAVSEGFISPVNNLEHFVPPHMTGGAVDLAIFKDGQMLNFGTEFDDFTEKANTMYFDGLNEKIHNNRMKLVNIMAEYGFTNYSAEWWHFDYGDQFWGAIKETHAIYGNIDIK